MAFDLTCVALLVEGAIGYPKPLYRAVRHPVVWAGALISALESRLNRPSLAPARRKANGVLTVIVLLACAMVPAALIENVLRLGGLGFLLAGVLGSTLLAQRSLYWHVARVAWALETGGLVAGREAVSHIVGRDPQSLDVSGVTRGAIESLAENFSDGVVAPTFWMLVGGLAGGAGYKALNTADSMIGHRNPRYEAFGWAAARLDDLVNLPASRLSGLLVVAAAGMLPGCSAKAAWEAMWRDAKHHRSPNAGWPEAAMAGALGISIAGPRSYGGVVANAAFMGNGRREIGARDIRAALRLYLAADMLMVTFITLGAILIGLM
ncbi:cobalamin biosynthesis protein CobD [Azorhizobium oxalatiphilum]|uniref:Cobalamin biosynthesis protein CobD n=1 Tax=Azorhizobium oxalatiphilum TaxID=980631 RepID=A0A917FBL4_9HYPH|nr:adenosylcobinamide-phosphate synthase CbiB [Azorhizobium oxalatiphilum]GGF59987.1 cobalamin biosynthesis protein CobD [Azorhizobium oxalatiphilum]